MATATIRTSAGNVKIAWPATINRKMRQILETLIRREVDEVHPIDDLRKELKKMDPSLGTPASTLQTYLELRGWTQTTLAEKTGIPQGHISDMKLGKRAIGLATAKKFGKAFGINYRRFL